MNIVAKTIELAYKAFHQTDRGIDARREKERGKYSIPLFQFSVKDENTLYVLIMFIPWNVKSDTNIRRSIRPFYTFPRSCLIRIQLQKAILLKEKRTNKQQE